MREVIAFAHGMSNFGHNRGTMLEQEALLRNSLRGNYSMLRIHLATGNYAVRTCLPVSELKLGLHQGLNKNYRVKEIMVVDRVDLVEALAVFQAECRNRYPDGFSESDLKVGKEQTRRRLGLVFVQHLYDVRAKYLEGFLEIVDKRIKVLGLHAGIVGLLKFDPITPRIPWGAAASFVEKFLKSDGQSGLATARSAQTVRGVLRLF